MSEKSLAATRGDVVEVEELVELVLVTVATWLDITGLLSVMERMLESFGSILTLTIVVPSSTFAPDTCIPCTRPSILAFGRRYTTELGVLTIEGSA